MSVRESTGIVAGILFVLVGFTPVTKTQAMNESTQVTFREAIRIPGQVLPAGSYFFERANHGNAPNLNLIQIYNGDHTRLLATIETAATERKFMTGETVMKFAEVSEGQPPALMAWFYPGMRDGYAFVYSPKTEKKLEASKVDFVVSDSEGSRRSADASGD